MAMNVDKFRQYVEYFINEEIPEKLIENLNLGIIVLDDEKTDSEDYIMGEYISDELGNYVILYYGSFKEILENETDTEWKNEIVSTLKHELVHHIEDLAGDEQLARLEELEDLQRNKKTQELKYLRSNKYNQQHNGVFKKIVSFITSLVRDNR